MNQNHTDNDQEIREFINWIKSKYQLAKLEIYDVQLLVHAARQANIEVNNQVRTALVLLMTQNGVTPNEAVTLFLEAQRKGDAGFVDQLIDKTLTQIDPHLREAAFLAKAEATAQFYEYFLTSPMDAKADELVLQNEAQIVSSLDSRKKALAARFQRLLNPQDRGGVDVEGIVANGNAIAAQQSGAQRLTPRNPSNILKLPTQQKEA
ncbi:MAG: hypothetical protein F6K54_05580 [Okeania sp. SIO3B5]|uniref:hypothetical protein n=1 Tax=Okeania sp. SIO3B5 TaxID=2607811 RepID=UPI00140020E6|nr:hypothetical protein [Okeania sp. SIO3B5]NEO52590.1 hypothetical protein [Okeania sp. SIO3B5]